MVTGAGSGVGRATARAFASLGAAVGLIARGEDSLEAAAKEVASAGGRALVLPTDVADADAVERAASRVEGELGPVEVWVNNAMTSVLAPFAETSAEEFRRVTEVTYLGQVYGTKAALRRMLPRDRGSIVCVGSALAYRGIPLQAAYCGAKHAVQGLTESVRAELAHDGSRVRITMVQLPAINTPQFEVVLSRLPHRPQPVPPIYQPEVAARAIVWASMHRRREVWVGGSTTATLLANQLAPGLLDRYLARTGYQGQQTSQRADPERPSNLWEPVPGDRGAHGPFDHRAHPRSAQAWTSRHHGLLAGTAALAAAGAAALRLTRARRDGRSGGA
ncbi:MAG TPA: SDR family oxidoreductase [Actinomycetes bacterium]|nr:SDR family oxidoreductase [Actinomycetes bacterium]